jgi:hypothetical protein
MKPITNRGNARRTELVFGEGAAHLHEETPRGG